MKTPPPTPRFPLGYPVRIGYLGLYRPDQQPTSRSGKPIDGTHVILGFRLVAELDATYPPPEEVETFHIDYPYGWEYFTGPADPNASRDRWNRNDWHEHGAWRKEKELLEKGYDPSHPAPWLARESLAVGKCDRCKLSYPGVRDGDLCKTCADDLAEKFAAVPPEHGGEG